MALSFEESRRNLVAQAQEAIESTVIDISEPAVATEDYGIATLAVLDENESIQAYAGESWTYDRTAYAYSSTFVDEDFSYVKDTKDIEVNSKQVNITQEENSQYIPFEINRYYDGYDLTDAIISIHYVNKNGNEAHSAPINVQYSSTKIRFGWLVDKNVTAIEGEVKFEIQATGQIKLSGESESRTYVWKTKPNGRLNILKSLSGNGIIEPDNTWMEGFLGKISAEVETVRNYSQQAQSAANTVNTAVNNAKTEITNDVNTKLNNYYKKTETYTKNEIDTKFNTFDVSSQLTGVTDRVDALEKNVGSLPQTLASDYYTKTVADNTFVKSSDFNTYKNDNDAAVSAAQATADAAQEKADDNADAISDINDSINDIGDLVDDLTGKFDDYYTSQRVDEIIEEAVGNIDIESELTDVNNSIQTLEQSIATNKENIDVINVAMSGLNASVDELVNSPTTYEATYTLASDEDPYKFTLWEVKKGEDENGEETEEKVAVSSFYIQGGGGGGTQVGSSIKIEPVTQSPVVASVNDRVIITYKFSGTDSAGYDVTEGTYSWRVGSRTGKVVASGTVIGGVETSFDITDYVIAGTTQKVFLEVVDEFGTLAQRSWNVQVVDLRLESKFNDKLYYNTGDVAFNYSAYGSIDKTVHFKLNGEEIGTSFIGKEVLSGQSHDYTIKGLEHGSHLLEVQMTAEISGRTIPSNVVVKDIICYDPSENTPVIGCAQQTFTVKQYDATNIQYTVYDPKNENPTVVLAVDGVPVSTVTMDTNTQIWQFKSSEVGTHTLTISCGDVVKTLTATVEKLDINVVPVTAGLVFDFDPSGRSNNGADRLWSYNDITMEVSDNFDWVNGGYQIDDNGDQYFCVKAGTRAVINYNLFADDPKRNGKEFKLVFRTKNIRKRDTSFLTCMDGNIGLDMKVENATIYESGGSTKSNYCEDAIIEYEFNINKSDDMPIVMAYEDGTPSMPYEYTEASSFKQQTPQPITIGSDNCDILIYRMKAYSSSLTDIEIKNNFIADARNADEMINRYNRNQIYGENGKLISTSASGDFSVEALMKAAPDLRYIFLEAPWFTNHKDNKVDGCTVYFKYPAGTRPEDNWKCVGVRHRGQGTSSNEYGYSGRNIDLVMDRDESLFTWVGENGETVESSTVTLTDTSVPTDYLNIKVNIASSENANNAEMARRFNEYQPFLRAARKKDSKVKDTMEFYNCVVFIRETEPDISKHREFGDTDWHFYAIGNVGDSKKTDDTRMNDKNDKKEHIVELMDVDKPLAEFPTGRMHDDAHHVYPIPKSEWCEGNSAYDILYSTDYVYDEEDGSFKSFGEETYEFRYEGKKLSEEEREFNINAWRDFYTFVVTSTDEEFYNNLKDYFVVDSALYYYLFTERYTMVDNRAKNSFWHYGKVYISSEEAAELGESASYYIIDDAAAAINNGYRYDLTQGYDFDTALGIDNTGDYVFPYGKEDTDYYSETDNRYVFRAANSVFFCRLRDLFTVELQAMFQDRENAGAWNSNSLINQWDESQAKFPEELWRLDYERKYYRTYLGASIDNSISWKDNGVKKEYLIGKFFGRKKYARRSFETNQEIYFATKYFGTRVLNDSLYIRGNVASQGSNVKQDYSLTLVPYSDMYVCVRYGSTGSPEHIRTKAGQVCNFENHMETMDFIYVYAASYIQEIGDLSKCYAGDNDFSKATRLQRLTIGNADEGYRNDFMYAVSVDNNPLLEYLDIRNVTGLSNKEKGQIINLSGCGNLKELYAEGTGAKGVIFANGGLLETAHLPEIASLSAKNLYNINDFVIDGYQNLETLIVENTPRINTYEIVTNAPKLRIVRLINLNWDETYAIEKPTVFEKLIELDGIDAYGYQTDLAVLTGYANVDIITQKQIDDYENAWPNLEIKADDITPQYTVTFLNENGDVLEVQYVNVNGDAVDPSKREDDKIIPTKSSTKEYTYEFAGWDKPELLKKVASDRIVTATFNMELKEYTIKYNSKGKTVYEASGKYGSYIPYPDSMPLPTYTGAESMNKFSLFNNWDKSGFIEFDDYSDLIDGCIVVNAIFDEFQYNEGHFDEKELADMTPIEIYALTKLKGTFKDIVTKTLSFKDPYSIKIGNDIDFNDIVSDLVISDTERFTGQNYNDTNIKLMEEDRDFVIAIDYEFLSGNSDGAVLAQCLHGFSGIGFKLFYDKGSCKLSWGGNTPIELTSSEKREMLVLRHKKGEKGVIVYNSRLDAAEVEVLNLDSTKEVVTDSTLVFGCHKPLDDEYENHAIGNVHWAKIWYKDLGDDACKSLAMWVHEDINFEVSGFNTYYLTDGTRCSFSLLASSLLSRKKRWSNTGSNAGGWGECDLRNSLNSRLYNAIPMQIRSLVKECKVPYIPNINVSEIKESNDFITVPSHMELCGNHSTYTVLNSEGSQIEYIHNNNDRIRAYVDGQTDVYWLRSLHTTSQSYAYTIKEDGEPNRISNVGNLYAVLISISF